MVPAWRRAEQAALEDRRLSGEEGLALLEGAPLPVLGALADRVRRRRHPEGVVTYIIDRNINHTNVCNAFCDFCAFYAAPNDRSGKAYVLAREELDRKIRETLELGGRQILLQGGHNPKLRIDYYEELFRHVKETFPELKLHALSPPEIVHVQKFSRLSLEETLDRLVAAGLDSIPGGGAEILVDRVREELALNKCSTDEWLEVMEKAHERGLRTTATMMFGHAETLAERIEHLLRLRELQDRSGGFTAFIPWTFQPGNTERGGLEATSHEYLRTLAVCRLVLDNFDNLQASWVTQGPLVGQVALHFGANDMGSTMIEENVVQAAGVGFRMDEATLCRLVREAGFRPMRRDMSYGELEEPPAAPPPRPGAGTSRLPSRA
jgi:cyclic dehypoxanthinyl futalosine synthase